MIGRLLNFVRKSPDNFHGNWGGQAAEDFDPYKNRVELLRFAAILLGDSDKTQVTSDEVLDCVQYELKVALGVAERVQFLSCLENHPSFYRVSENLFEIV